MEDIKIAFIITRLDLGGAQKSALCCAANLKKPFSVSLLCGKGGLLDAQAKETLHKNVIFINSLTRRIAPFKDFAALFWLVKRLYKIKPDIVHTHSSKAGVLGRIAAFIFKKLSRQTREVKIIHTVHGFSFNDFQNPLIKSLFKFIEKQCNKLAHVIIFVSQNNMNKALSLGLAPKDKCRLIRAGVEFKTKKDFPSPCALQTRSEYGFKETDKIVFTAANLKPQKNPLDLIKAAGEVCKQIPSAKFLFAGDGALKREAESLIKRLGLQKNFFLLGVQKNVWPFLNIADVFALSSLWEGLPNALPEALSMKVPCVCYDTDGINEIIKNQTNGFYVPRGDYRALAKKIICVLENGLNFKNGDSLKEFDAKNVLKKLEKLYKEKIYELF
jgi:glycosyltransferase involved in cell wall biosynthesis